MVNIRILRGWEVRTKWVIIFVRRRSPPLPGKWRLAPRTWRGSILGPASAKIWRTSHQFPRWWGSQSRVPLQFLRGTTTTTTRLVEIWGVGLIWREIPSRSWREEKRQGRGRGRWAWHCSSCVRRRRLSWSPSAQILHQWSRILPHLSKRLGNDVCPQDSDILAGVENGGSGLLMGLRPHRGGQEGFFGDGRRREVNGR